MRDHTASHQPKLKFVPAVRPEAILHLCPLLAMQAAVRNAEALIGDWIREPAARPAGGIPYIGVRPKTQPGVWYCGKASKSRQETRRSDRDCEDCSLSPFG